MPLEGTEFAAQVEEPQVTPETTPEPSDAGDLAHLADTPDDDTFGEPATGELPEPEKSATPALPAPPEISPEVRAQLDRLAAYERNETARRAVEDEARRQTAIEQEAAKEQAETRALNARMRDMGQQAQTLVEQGRIKEAEDLQVQALDMLNTFNQEKAEQRLVSKIQAAEAQKQQTEKIFAWHVEEFIKHPDWGGQFCDPNKPEESRQIAVDATLMKANGYNEDQIHRHFTILKNMWDNSSTSTHSRQQTASQAADKARAHAGMEAPTGGAPASKREKSEDAMTENVLGMWFGKRPK